MTAHASLVPRLLAGLLLLALAGASVTPAGADDDDDDDQTVVDDAAGDDDDLDEGGLDQDDDDGAPAPILDDDGDPTTDGFRAGQLVVRLAAGADPSAVGARYGITLLRSISARRLALVGLPPGIDEAALTATLSDDPEIVWVERNVVGQAPEGRPRDFFITATRLPAPPAIDYAATLIGLADAHRCALGDGIVIAVVDTGIDAAHPDLLGRVLAGGWNVIADSPDTADVGNGLDDDGDGLTDEMTGHGAQVAGIIARVAPGAVILPLKALDSDGVGDAFYVAEAIYRALDGGARVINLSLGSTHDARVVHEAVRAAKAHGAVVVAAAGNLDREEPAEHPAAGGIAIGVAATDGQDQKADFSNFHSSVGLSAPGVEIVGPLPGGGYASWSGTSMATPFVAAAAALLLGEHPTWSPDRVAEQLTATAAPIALTGDAHDGKLGAGRLRIGAALACDDGA